jgi:hypothetical protein
MTVLMDQTALYVQKVLLQMLPLASITAMPRLILLTTEQSRMKETSTASMRGQLKELQDLALAYSAPLALKAITARLLLSV